MTRIVFVNGEFVEEAEAKISVFDRGFLFADAVYEVTSVLGGKLIDWPGHVARLERSLGELGMGMPMDEAALLSMHRALVSRNGIDEGLVYLQVTRGAADRDFLFPAPDVAQSVVAFTQDKDLVDTRLAEQGMRVATVPDIRWGRRDIKTVQLLPASMAKMAAKAEGKDDAWMLDEEGFVTEGTSNNAYIVTAEGTIVTRNLSHSILHGITRASVLRLAGEAQMKIEERPFTLAEAQAAREAFVTAASTFVCPVVEIDGAPVGDGAVGPIARRLREIYLEDSLRSAV